MYIDKSIAIMVDIKMFGFPNCLISLKLTALLRNDFDFDNMAKFCMLGNTAACNADR